MTEWFKVADCKSVGFPIVGSNPTFFLTKYDAVGSVPVLGTGSHVFKSHYFEKLENFFNLYIVILFKFLIKFVNILIVCLKFKLFKFLVCGSK